MMSSWRSSSVRRGVLAVGSSCYWPPFPLTALLMTLDGSPPAAARAVDRGTAVTASPPGTVLGSVHPGDAVAAQAPVRPDHRLEYDGHLGVLGSRS